MKNRKGWYEKREYIPSIGRYVAPRHRVAALKGQLHGKKRSLYHSKKITLHSDADKDRVPDIKDCDPYDKTQQDILKKIKEYRTKAKEAQKLKKEAVYAEELKRLEKKEAQLREEAEKLEKLAKKREEIAKLQERLKKAKDAKKRSTLAYQIKAKAKAAVKELGKEAEKALMEKPKPKKKKSTKKRKTTKKKTTKKRR